MHGLMRLQKNTEVRMIIDANVILRCILNDNQQLAMQAKSLIENNDCFVPNEVVAEVVFVLQKVYKKPQKAKSRLNSRGFCKKNVKRSHKKYKKCQNCSV